MLKRVQIALGNGVKAGTRGSGLVLAVALSALGWSGMAAALGMGEIRLHSALNQPLNAEIQLIETAGVDANDVIVKLASPEAFAKAGIERSFFLNDLRFTPVLRGNSGYIEVSSNKAVVEPYLNFLVQLSRPNGDLLHEYTVLLDPATSPEGLAATRERKRLQEQAAVRDTRMPVAPPMAVQGKHYTVVEGDTLGGISRRLQGAGTKATAAQLAEGIQALNPLAFPGGAGTALKAGQNLLLPDAAVVPTPPAGSPAVSAEVPPVVADQQSAAQLAADAISQQQVEDLKNLNRNLQEQVFERDKAVTVLQARLAEMREAASVANPATAAASAPVAAPAPVVAAAPVAVAQDNPLFSLPVLLGIVLVLVLVIVVLRLRQRLRPAPRPGAGPPDLPVHDEALIKPAQATVLPVYEVPAVSPAPAVAAQVSTATAEGTQAPKTTTQRSSGGAPDALDGVSIYIAYGRFNEALAILRDALHKEPGRADIRERILELLAEQGDIIGFERDAQAALEHGITAEQIQAIRSRYPQLNASQGPRTGAPAAAVAGAAALGAAAVVQSAAADKPDLAKPEVPAQLDETAAAALNPEHADEFQLNLDDLSMDADWDLVDPFEKPASRDKAEEPVVAAFDPHFASNLTELPEVFELQEEPVAQEPFEVSFSADELGDESIEVIAPSGLDPVLSEGDLLDGLEDFGATDFGGSTLSGLEVVDELETIGSDALDDDFLDSFADEEGMEFDLLELDEEPLTQINQAQLMIDEGDVEGARRLLQQVLDGADEAHQQMARDLLSSLD